LSKEKNAKREYQNVRGIDLSSLFLAFLFFFLAWPALILLPFKVKTIMIDENNV
jgi:hypothetical protein